MRICSTWFSTDISKITYDLDQVLSQQLPALRDSLLNLILKYGQGPKPIRTQLCVCLANLAIQMLDWKDVLERVASTLANAAGDALLEFLRVLPEEVTEGRKINLSVCGITASHSSIMRTPLKPIPAS